MKPKSCQWEKKENKQKTKKPDDCPMRSRADVGLRAPSPAAALHAAGGTTAEGQQRECDTERPESHRSSSWVRTGLSPGSPPLSLTLHKIPWRYLLSPPSQLRCKVGMEGTKAQPR